jgi:hypothetical protein
MTVDDLTPRVVYLLADESPAGLLAQTDTADAEQAFLHLIDEAAGR